MQMATFRGSGQGAIESGADGDGDLAEFGIQPAVGRR